MKYRLLDALVCPRCRYPLECEPFLAITVRRLDNKILSPACHYRCYKEGINLTSFNKPSGIDCEDCYRFEVIDGLLRCNNCASWYPIIGGIPRMLLGDLMDNVFKSHQDFVMKYQSKLPASYQGTPYTASKLHQRRTMESFGFEWTSFADYSADNFRDFIRPLPPNFFVGKVGLDAGCGAGRHLREASKRGAEMFGVDLSAAVEVAFENNRDINRVHIIQADIYNLPFRPSYFDFIYSLGVLQHLPDPQKGFNSLLPFLKPRGTIFIWVYYRSFRKRLMEWIRKVSTKLSSKSQYYLALLCALIDYGILVNTYKITTKVRPLKRWVELISPPRIKEYASYNFRVSHADWFDRLSAPITHFFTEDEVRRWFEDSGCLKEVRIIPFEDFWWWGSGVKEL
ncbi:MAG: hypothetical protein DRP95_01655 [Candidatus Latescibacterota bacterium]|nr:MAG: hypothetical protein DRP95_01655 [Candidatus Latescibacterota bacterium]